MNNKVTVTGMQVNTKVSNNLFITTDTIGSTSTIKTDSSYKFNNIQHVSALLEPVSTVDGKAFFYTLPSNVLPSGDASSDVYAAYTTPSDFASAIGIDGASGYADYVFQIKAVNTSTAGAASLVLNKLALTYGGNAGETAYRAFRVAMFVENLDTVINSTKATTAQAPTGDLTGVDKAVLFAPANAVNFTAEKAVKTTTTLDTVTYCSDTTTAKWDVAADTTAYFKVVVRLWLEGEDNTCNNETFVQLTDNWALDLEFTLDSYNAATPTTPVQNLVINNTASKIDLSAATATATTQIIDGETYYQLSVATYYTTDSTFAATSHVYTIANGHVTDITNQCKLPA